MKLPWDSGDGRVKRGAGEEEEGVDDELVGEVAVVGTDGVIPDGRDDVVAEEEFAEDDEPLRWCRLRRGLECEDADWAGDGELRAGAELALVAVLLLERVPGPAPWL